MATKPEQDFSQNPFTDLEGEKKQSELYPHDNILTSTFGFNRNETNLMLSARRTYVYTTK